MSPWVMLGLALILAVVVVDCHRIGFPFLDQEEDDDGSASGYFEHVETDRLPTSSSPASLKVSLAWVTYTREGQKTIVKDGVELNVMLWQVRLHVALGKDRVCSANAYLPPTRDRNSQANCVVGEVGENCHAFMVGPRHALTVASCVYSAGRFKTSLNMACARNCRNSSSNGTRWQLQWESVRIPHPYYRSENESYNWAFITFSPRTQTTAWLSFSHDPFVMDRRSRLQAYGHCPGMPRGCMCGVNCRNERKLAPGTIGSRVMSFDCNAQMNLHGGPVLAASTANSCAVNAISHSSWTNSSSLLHNATWISAEMFWQVCTWLQESRHTPQCGPAACKQNIRFSI